MIDQAVISGQLGVALLSSGEEFLRLNAFEKQPVELLPSERSLFFGLRTELALLDSDDLTQRSVEDELAFLTNAHTVLALFASGIDPTLSTDTRTICFSAIEDLLGNDSVERYVRNRLLGKPAAPTADLIGAVGITEGSSNKKSLELIREVAARQSAVVILYHAWDAECVARSIVSADKEELERSLIDSGAFEGYSRALTKGSGKSFGIALVTAASDKSLRGVPGAPLLLNALRTRLQKIVGSDGELVKVSQLSDREWPNSEIQANDDPILEAISEQREGHRHWRRKVSPFDAKKAVDKQINGIRVALSLGEFGKADQYLLDLIRFHSETGEREHMGMTLCSLAKIAIDANELEYAEKLADYALKLGVEDSVIYATKAEVLRESGRLRESLEAYKYAMTKFPDSDYLPCGYAEVLREMGRYKESADAYSEAKRIFPNSPVPWAGLAEAYRSAGDYNKALRQYQLTTEQFPGFPIPHSGYVEVLKAMGRYASAVKVAEQNYASFAFDPRVGTTYGDALKAAGRLDQALALFDNLRRRFPEMDYAASSYADTLRRLGRLKEAITEYDKILDLQPNYLGARLGKARVLVTLGDLTAARTLIAYYHRLRSVLDWRVYRTLSLIMLKEGIVEDAIRRLEYGYQSAPWAAVRSRFATSLGYAKLTLRSFRDAHQLLKTGVEQLERDKQSFRLLLIGHLSGELGRPKKAIELLDRVKASPDQQLIQLRGEIISLYGLEGRSRLRQSEIAALRQRVQQHELVLAITN